MASRTLGVGDDRVSLNTMPNPASPLTLRIVVGRSAADIAAVIGMSADRSSGPVRPRVQQVAAVIEQFDPHPRAGGDP